MKKIFMFLLMMMLALSSYAQNNVTKFLGIPVDGSREKMEKELKKKGFVKSPYNKEVLEGEFNGKNVRLYIGTNKNKVRRIVVIDSIYTRENEIKNRYNILYNQFLNNSKYVLARGEMIDKKEDISYGMTVKNKTYETVFYQVGTFEEVDKALLSKYTEEQLNNPSEKLKKEIKKDIMEMIENKLVWFRINEYKGEYTLAVYYDNMYNFSNGEDL